MMEAVVCTATYAVQAVRRSRALISICSQPANSAWPECFLAWQLAGWHANPAGTLRRSSSP